MDDTIFEICHSDGQLIQRIYAGNIDIQDRWLLETKGFVFNEVSIDLDLTEFLQEILDKEVD